MVRLRAGDTAPSFVAQTMDGQTITSEALEEQRVLLAFRRYAACPVCNEHLANYRVRNDELRRAGIRVISIFHSPASRLAIYFKPADLPFDVVTDPDFELYRAFGVAKRRAILFRPRSLAAAIPAVKQGYGSDQWGEWDGTAKMAPANFLLHRGKVAAAHYGRHLGDACTVDDALMRAWEVWEKPKLDGLSAEAAQGTAKPAPR